MKGAICFVTFLALSVAASDVRAQMGGNPREGQAAAQQMCSGCHNPANPKSSALAELAATPGMTGTPLLLALTTPHAGMPVFKLTAAQRDNIVAYILSLRD